MRAILLSRKDFKRPAADEAAGRPPVDDARWREVATVHLSPYALLHLLRLTPHTLHNTPHASHFALRTLEVAGEALRCHRPPWLTRSPQALSPSLTVTPAPFALPQASAVEAAQQMNAAKARLK